MSSSLDEFHYLVFLNGDLRGIYISSKSLDHMSHMGAYKLERTTKAHAETMQVMCFEGDEIDLPSDHK